MLVIGLIKLMTTGCIMEELAPPIRLKYASGDESAVDGHVTKKTCRLDSFRKPRQPYVKTGLNR